jgi:hypothetical protein
MPSIDDDPGPLLKRIATTHWQTIARHAWSLYQDRGRGAIVLSMQDPGASGKQPLRYLTFRGDRDEIAKSSMAMLHELVASYDPHQEAVVAVILPDDRTVFDVFAKTPPPVDTAS